MRKKLIILSAIFAIIGIISDQLAFFADDELDILRENRKEAERWLDFDIELLQKFSVLSTKLEFSKQGFTKKPESTIDIVVKDLEYFINYMLEDEYWV